MLIPEFKAAAAEVAAIMEAREPLGFRVAELNASPLPSIRCKAATDYNGSFRIGFFTQGRRAAAIEGQFYEGPVCGIDDLRFVAESGWEQTGLNKEVMRRFIYGMNVVGGSYINTGSLRRGIPFFKKLGFHHLTRSVGGVEARENFRIPDELEKGVSLAMLVQQHRCGHPRLARMFGCMGIYNTTALLDLTDPPHRDHVFEKLRLPVLPSAGVK